MYLQQISFLFEDNVLYIIYQNLFMFCLYILKEILILFEQESLNPVLYLILHHLVMIFT